MWRVLQYVFTADWESLHRHATTTEDPELVFFVVLPMLVLLCTYWIIGGALLALDFVPPLRSWVRHRKCQPQAQPSARMVLKICAVVGTQMLTIYPLALYLIRHPLSGHLNASKTLPTAAEFLWSAPLYLISTEIWFFYVHWFLHHPKLYPYIHKVHHEFTAPIALECLYFHPVESVAQFGTVVLGPFLLGSHVTLLYLWEFLSIIAILLHHSGYEVPMDGVPGVLGSMSHFHDYHHQKYNRNFGVIGVLDRIHNTDQGYTEHICKWEAKLKGKA